MDGSVVFCDKWFDSLFEAGNIYNEPFFHIHKSEVFSKTFFDKLKRNFITKEKLKETSNLLRSKFQEDNRKSFFLSKDMLVDIIEESERDFWKDFIIYLERSANEIKNGFLVNIQKMGIGKGLILEQVSLSIRFVTEELPYILEPHVDKPQKLAVGVVYIESDGCDHCGGTQLFSNSTSNNLSLMKRYDFIENDFLLIPREPNTWHGGDWAGKGQRKTLHIYLFRHNDGHEALKAREKFSFMI